MLRITIRLLTNLRVCWRKPIREFNLFHYLNLVYTSQASNFGLCFKVFLLLHSIKLCILLQL